MWILFNKDIHKLMSRLEQLDDIENLIFGLKKEINMLSSEMQALSDSSDAMVLAANNAVAAINALVQEVADLTANQGNPEDVAQMTKLTADLNAAKDALAAVTPAPVAPVAPVEPPVG